jgi:hypothetical protein
MRVCSLSFSYVCQDSTQQGTRKCCRVVIFRSSCVSMLSGCRCRCTELMWWKLLDFTLGFLLVRSAGTGGSCWYPEGCLISAGVPVDWIYNFGYSCDQGNILLDIHLADHEGCSHQFSFCFFFSAPSFFLHHSLMFLLLHVLMVRQMFNRRNCWISSKLPRHTDGSERHTFQLLVPIDILKTIK